MQNEEINNINDELLYDPDADEVTNEGVTTAEPEEHKETKTTTETTAADAGDEEPKVTPAIPETVPYQRFKEKVHESNELKEKNRELELELARLQGAASVTQVKKEEEPTKEQEVNIKQLRRDYYEAMTIGDDDKALEIQEQIDTYNDKQNEIKAMRIAEKVIKEREEAKQKEHEQVIQAENKKIIDEFMDKYGYLNDESAEFEPDSFEIFSAFYKAAIESGNKTFKESLDYAVNKVENLTNKQPAPTPKKEVPRLTKEQIDEQLKRAAAATPQISKKGTTGNDIAVDPADMSEEEYEKFRDGGGKFNFEINA